MSRAGLPSSRPSTVASSSTSVIARFLFTVLLPPRNQRPSLPFDLFQNSKVYHFERKRGQTEAKKERGKAYLATRPGWRCFREERTKGLWFSSAPRFRRAWNPRR